MHQTCDIEIQLQLDIGYDLLSKYTTQPDWLAFNLQL